MWSGFSDYLGVANWGWVMLLWLWILFADSLIVTGVLFSIETTSTYYQVKNYYFSFLSSVMAAVYYKWMINSQFPEATIIPLNSWVYMELFAFAALGIYYNNIPRQYNMSFFFSIGAVAGILSASFTTLVSFIEHTRRWFAFQAKTSNKFVNSTIQFLAQLTSPPQSIILRSYLSSILVPIFMPSWLSMPPPLQLFRETHIIYRYTLYFYK